MSVDETNIYSWTQDRFNFNDTRMVNAHIDYLSRVVTTKIERCFQTSRKFPTHVRLTTNQLGYMDILDDDSHDIKIVVKDFNGNADHF